MKKRTLIVIASIIALLGVILLAVFVNAADTDPGLRIVGCNLSFQDNIYIKYAVDGTDLSDVKLLIWTKAQTSYEYGTQSAVLESTGTETVSGKPCKIFSYSSLTARMMTDNVYARAYVVKSGTAYYSPVKKYSILQYVYNKTGRTGTATTNQKLIDLLNAMIEYGSAAQIYAGYKTDRLANAEWYQIKVSGGTIDDQSTEGLYLPGDSVSMTAPATNDQGQTFSHWKTYTGEIAGTETTLTVTAVASDKIYTAVYSTPQRITTRQEFLAMSPDGNYYLDADIAIPRSYGAGDTIVPFTGTLDGNGHRLIVTGNPLFAEIGQAVIKNLTIEGFVDSDTDAGALAAYCSADVSYYCSNYAVIANCTNKASVTMTVPDSATANSYMGVGGFIGHSRYNCGAMFINCVNEGNVVVKCTKTENMRFYAGGFAGICDTFLARNSENHGNVRFEGDWANCLNQDGCGGFVGRVAENSFFNYVNIEHCINYGYVKGGRYAGGFVAYAGVSGNVASYEMDNTPYRFFGNINYGGVEGKRWAGGIAGFLYVNSGNSQQSIDMQFNLIDGSITSSRWCAPFVAYSNSRYNSIKYNVSTCTLDAQQQGSDEIQSWMFCFLGCSSCDYREDSEIHDNYITENDYQWLCYAEYDSNADNRIDIDWGIENNYVTIVTLEQLATGEIAYLINSAAGINGFNQTIGTDLTPTPDTESLYVVRSGSGYANSETPEFPPLKYYNLP